jgi:adenylate cyclase
MLKRIFQGIGIGIVAGILSLVLWQADALTHLEAKTWDWRAARLSKPGPATDRVRLIFLDQYSLDWGKARGWDWPWPRQVYTAILDFCRRGNAKAVAFDVIYSEPSPWGVEDDAAFGNAIRRSGNFVGAVFVANRTGGQTNWPADIPPPAVSLKTGSATTSQCRPLARATFPIPEVATNAALLATVFGNPDSDGIYRRLKPFSRFDGQVVPSLGLASRLTAPQDRHLSLSGDFFSTGPSNTRLPIDRDGNVILHFRGPSQTHKTVNVAAVIESELRIQEGKPPIIPPSFFTNAYVFFGFTAPGLFDLKPTPVSAVYPGVELHATFLDNLLAADFMRDTPPAWVITLTFLLAMTGAIGVRLGRTAWQNVLTFVVLLPIPTLLGLLAYTRGQWLPIVIQYTALAPALVGALAINFATEGKQKRFIKGAFKQYLSPVVIEELVQHPERLKLGGETRTLSLFFSDVKGFTGLSEHLTPEQLTTLLNDYLTAMTDVIYANGGTVDKYEGDAIIAFWNAPLSQHDHALRAVRAALECQQRLSELNPTFHEQVGTSLIQRIGINSGPVVVGNMGSRQRFNYTFLGDAGNLASRLEGINKQFGTTILISESTRHQLDDSIAARELGLVRVIGRREPVRIFEPMLPAQAAARQDLLARFAKALAAFYAGDLRSALQEFQDIAAGDPAAAAYASRYRITNLPMDKWDGIWIMTEK